MNAEISKSQTAALDGYFRWYSVKLTTNMAMYVIVNVYAVPKYITIL